MNEEKKNKLQTILMGVVLFIGWAALVSVVVYTDFYT